MQAVTALARGHGLFARELVAAPVAGAHEQVEFRTDGLPTAAAKRSASAMDELRRSAGTDRMLARILATARAGHGDSRTATRRVLDDAMADTTSPADTPLARREAMARMAARLRTQHRHILNTRRRARLLALRIRRLRYRQRRTTMRGEQGGGRPAVVAAIRKALDIKGIHDPAARARWERGMDLVARRESNYNAGAVNDWDSNAARGTPSKGAWQFIGPTFAAYHEPGTSRDIHNLVAQACAFINYAMGRYGVSADASNLADRIQQADPRRAPKGY
ncbi:transglycosylase [Mycobacterium sp. E735]|uniref:transglycosylase SLT domain-containing protein n=1 Tax=Mycobacterium sp. E735 TaxID=1834148 RepID=UPI00080082CF|nr:transglycosylase [Mycobacterium sp. E735]OBG64672.1 transglycosylase [Mycobacterium sp. E735]